MAHLFRLWHAQPLKDGQPLAVAGQGGLGVAARLGHLAQFDKLKSRWLSRSREKFKRRRMLCSVSLCRELLVMVISLIWVMVCLVQPSQQTQEKYPAL